MEKLMSNSDLIWMRGDDIFTHQETSKPYLVSHNVTGDWAWCSGGPTLAKKYQSPNYTSVINIILSNLLNIIGNSSPTE